MAFLDKFQKPLDLSTPGIRLPEFKLSDEDAKAYNIPAGYSNTKILRELCVQGYKARVADGTIPKDKAKEYGDRVKKELSILEKTNFVDYILIIYDLISFRNRKNLARSYGRGSCAGSLVCHLIGITNCDPVKNGLYFERFISESRAKTNVIDGVIYLSGTLPDVDMDLADAERHELVNYLMSKYPERVVKLSTISTYATKSLVGDLCKVFFGWGKEEYEFLTKQVVPKFGKNPSPEEVRKESKIFDDFCNKNPVFTDCLYKLHECNKGNSSHASAYFVSYEPLNKVMPIQMGKIINEDGEEEGELERISAYDMYTSETLGIKVDLLGVKSLTMVSEIAQKTGEDIYNLDFNDYDSIYSHLDNLQLPHGLFQISGHAAIKGLNKIKPKNLEELSVVNAICRPGAMEFIDDYAEYTNNGVKKSLHPFFDEILDKTAGKVIFQETLLEMFNKIGFTLEECEGIRRMVGKKQAEKLPAIKEKALQLCEKNKIPKEAVDIALSVAESSVSYSFNKCAKKDSEVITDKGVKKLYEISPNDNVLCYDRATKKDIFVKVLNVYKNRKKMYEVEAESGHKIQTSIDHKYLCEDGTMRSLRKIIKTSQRLCVKSLAATEFSKIKKITPRDDEDTIDLEVDHPDHNFYCNGIVVSNSHAVAYSQLTAATVYLKWKYPTLFFLEALKKANKESPKVFKKNINEIITELPFFGIKLLPPDLVKSKMDFAIEGKDIRYGLSSIKGIKEINKIKAIENLKYFINDKTVNKFQIFQLAKENKLNLSIMVALVQAGCLDSLNKDRSLGTLEIKIWNKLRPREQEYCVANGHKYKFDLIAMLKDFTNWHDGKSFKESRLQTIRRDTKPFMEIFKHNKEYPLFTAFEYESELLGFSYTTTLKDIFINHHKDIVNISELKNLGKDSKAAIVAKVLKSKRSVSKNGNDMLFMEVADNTGIIIARMMKEKLANYVNHGKIPEEDDIVIIRGSVGEGVMWCERLAIHEYKLAFKISDLKGKTEDTNEMVVWERNSAN